MGSPPRSNEPKAIDTCRSAHGSCLLPAQRNASEGPGAYFVDNSLLRSEQEGLHFYRTMDMSEAACKAWVPWGAVIQGIPIGNDWIRVGDYYLPVRLNGVVVLKREASFLAGTARSHGCKTANQATTRKVGTGAVVMRPRMQSPCGSPGPVHVASRVPVQQLPSRYGITYPSLVPAPPRAVATVSPHSIAYTIPNSTWAPPPHTVPYTYAKLAQAPTLSSEPSSRTWMLVSTVGGSASNSAGSCETGCGPCAA